MANQAKAALPGYTSPVGYSRKLVWAGDVFGSNNYQQGGYTDPANGYGMVAFEKYGIDFGGLTIAGATLGTYKVTATPAANIAVAGEGQAPCFTSVVLKWFYAANNAEVANNTDLSAQGVRVDTRGV